jgi:hypothetical protein
MKIVFDFENGMQLSLKPENVSLVDNGGKNSVLITKTDQTVVPLIFFTPLLATQEELKAREDKAKAAATIASEEKAKTPVQGGDPSGVSSIENV